MSYCIAENHAWKINICTQWILNCSENFCEQSAESFSRNYRGEAEIISRETRGVRAKICRTVQYLWFYTDHFPPSFQPHLPLTPWITYLFSDKNVFIYGLFLRFLTYFFAKCLEKCTKLNFFHPLLFIIAIMNMTKMRKIGWREKTQLWKNMLTNSKGLQEKNRPWNFNIMGIYVLCFYNAGYFAKDFCCANIHFAFVKYEFQIWKLSSYFWGY